MIKPTTKLLSCLAAFALTLSAAAHAQENNALLEALVKKGILTDQEAEDIRADLVKEHAKTSAGKINISSSLNELKIYGDVRFRFQYDNYDLQVSKAPGQTNYANNFQRDRWRFRLRLNADYKFAGPFFAGVGLETSAAADSGNQTFADANGGAGFSKYDIFISKVFLGWNVTDWLTLIAGKQKNPFYTTELIWDADINPTGLVETVAIHKLFGWETVESGGYSKDGKSVAPTAETVWNAPRWEATLNLGQFIFSDNNEYDGPDNDLSTDAYLFVNQLVLGYKVAEGVKVTAAPGWMFFNAADVVGSTSFNERPFNVASSGSNTLGQTRDLNILLLPGDVSFKLAGLPASFYWDFGYNVDGAKRANDIYQILSPGTNSSLHQTEDDIAFLIGFQIGQNKKQGDWSFNFNWRQVGVAAVDPNLNDSDFGLSNLNIRGLKTNVAYSFTDYIIGGVTYQYAWNLRDNLYEGQTTNNAAIARINTSQIVQVDLSWKF